jgi:hypothetical protein
LLDATNSAPREHKTFDAPNDLCAYIVTSSQVNCLPTLEDRMRHARTYIAKTADRDRLPSRAADRSRMSVMTMSVMTMCVAIWGPNFQLEAGLNRKARV